MKATTTYLTGRAVLAVALTAGLAAATPARAEGDVRKSLDDGLRVTAEKVIQFARARGYHSVGVLKYHVQVPRRKPSDNVGPLNLSIPSRLEMALVLANPDEKLGIIEKASATVVAAGAEGQATHLTAEGTKKLFRIKGYRLAWGPQRTVKPSAFVFGWAVISPDLKETTVTTKVVDETSEKTHFVDAFRTPTDARTLSEAGISFSRSFFDDERLAAKDHTPEKPHTPPSPTHTPDPAPVRPTVYDQALNSSYAPVELQIWYNGRPILYKVTDGQAVVPEPQAGTELYFVLKHTGRDQKRYGVVLLVNGQNTLFQETGNPLQLRKWILDPGDKTVINGFQKTDWELAPFRVLSPEESRGLEVNYKEHAGTFTFIVFQEKQGVAPPSLGPPPGAPGFDILAALSRGAPPGDKRAGNLKSLQKSLLQKRAPAEGSRGFVVEGGGRAKSEIQKVSFTPDPNPERSVTIRYYQSH
jgi:hypothetical protein